MIVGNVGTWVDSNSNIYMVLRTEIFVETFQRTFYYYIVWDGMHSMKIRSEQFKKWK